MIYLDNSMIQIRDDRFPDLPHMPAHRIPIIKRIGQKFNYKRLDCTEIIEFSDHCTERDFDRINQIEGGNRTLEAKKENRRLSIISEWCWYLIAAGFLKENFEATFKPYQPSNRVYTEEEWKQMDGEVEQDVYLEKDGKLLATSVKNCDKEYSDKYTMRPQYKNHPMWQQLHDQLNIPEKQINPGGKQWLAKKFDIVKDIWVPSEEDPTTNTKDSVFLTDKAYILTSTQGKTITLEYFVNAAALIPFWKNTGKKPKCLCFTEHDLRIIEENQDIIGQAIGN